MVTSLPGLRVTLLVAGFFCGMLLVDLCLEMLLSLPNLPATIALWNSTLSFLFCALLPLLLRSWNVGDGCDDAVAAGPTARAKSQVGPDDDRHCGAEKLPPETDEEMTCINKACEVPGDEAPQKSYSSEDGLFLAEALDLEEDAPLKELDRRRCNAPLALCAKMLPFLLCSVLQFGSSMAANHAVHFVEYKVKVVFKASKLLPTMVLATAFGNTRTFTFVEYSAALLLSVGTGAFFYGSGKHSANGAGLSLDTIFGMCLLLASILAEGFVANYQQQLMSGAGGVSPNQMMVRMNLSGALGGLLALSLSQDLTSVLAHAKAQPRAPPLLLTIAVALACGVACYTRLIREVGSVFAVTVSTLRKSVTLMLSFLVFPGKAFTVLRGVGLLLLLVGLVLAENAKLFQSRTTSSEPSRCSARSLCSIVTGKQIPQAL